MITREFKSKAYTGKGNRFITATFYECDEGAALTVLNHDAFDNINCATVQMDSETLQELALFILRRGK